MLRLVILRLLESLFRRFWLYPIPIVVMVLAAIATAMTTPPIYRSSGMLVVQGQSLVASLNNLPGQGSSWYSPSSTAVSQIHELLQTEAFVRSVVKGTPLEAQMNGSAEQKASAYATVLSAIWIQSSGENLVRFGANYDDPETAARLAQGLVEGYIIWKLNTDRQDSIAAQAFFRDLLVPYQAELDEAQSNLERYIMSNPAPIRGTRPEEEQIELTRLQNDVRQAEQRVQDIIQKEETAQLRQIQDEQGIRQGYLMIDAPTVPIMPANGLRQRVMDSMIFIAVGVVLSLGAVVGNAVLDRSLRFPIDSVHQLYLPVLAVVPSAKVSELPADNKRAVPHVVRSSGGEHGGGSHQLAVSVAPSTND